MSDDFDFSEGDRVLVRVREHGTSGNIVGKFEADVTGFREGRGFGSDQVELDPPWDSMTPVRLADYDAEFEVLE